jgi:protein O-GlcNAc transferase
MGPLKACLLLLFPLVAALAGVDADLSGCAKALDRGDYAQAARQAQSYIQSHPSSASARVLLARAYMGMNNGHAALNALHEALEKDPEFLDALYYLSKLTGILSLQEFAVVSELAPESARMHQIKAEALEAHGDGSGAEREYLEALEKRPGTAYILNALGDLKRHQGEYDAGLAWYRKVLDKDPENYDALYGAGACYRLARSPENALDLFRRALKVDPASIAAKMALGESLLFTGKTQEALPLLEEAARIDPRLRRLQYMLARAYRSLGRNKDAQQAFERFKKLADSSTENDLPAIEEKQ